MQVLDFVYPFLQNINYHAFICIGLFTRLVPIMLA